MVLALVLAVAAFGMVMTGCSSQAPEKDVPPAELFETVVNVAEMDKVFPVEDDIASQLYNDLDLSLLEAYSFNIPMINVKSAEITIVKVKDVKDVETVKAAMEVRHENVKQTWEHYLPDQYEQVMNGQIVVNGRYLMFIVAPDVEKRVEAFNNALK